MDAYALSLKFQTEGFDDVFRKLDDVDSKGKRVAQTAESSGVSVERIGHKAAGVAIALSGMGEVGVSAMEKVAHGATNIAFMFGAAGPIVGAAAIAGVAIFNIFDRARKEMEATDKKARDLLRGLSLDTGVSTLSSLYGGDPYAKKGTPEQLGIAAAKARLNAIPVTMEDITDPATGMTVGRAVAANKERDDLLAFLKEAEPLYARVMERTKALAAAEVERGQNLIQLAEDERLAKLAQDAYIPPVTAGKMPGISDVSSETSVYSTRPDTLAVDAEKRKLAIANQLDPVKARAKVTIDQATLDIAEKMKEVQDEMGSIIQTGFAETLGNAIYNGFAAAFSGKGISGLLKSFAKTILAGIGQTFTQLGMVYLQYGVLMQGLASFLPDPFTAGWAGIAIGAALVAMGAALGAVGQGKSAGSTGGYSAPSYSSNSDQVTRIRLMPGWATESGVTERSPNNFNFTVIGQNDPQAQREIAGLVRNAERRGL